MSTLILPGQQLPASPLDTLPPVVWLRNPKTGVINKFLSPKMDDTIKRCISEGFTQASEEAARAQAIELAELQGRPLPAWAAKAEPEKPAETPVAEKPEPGYIDNLPTSATHRVPGKR